MYRLPPAHLDDIAARVTALASNEFEMASTLSMTKSLASAGRAQTADGAEGKGQEGKQEGKGGNDGETDGGTDVDAARRYGLDKLWAVGMDGDIKPEIAATAIATLNECLAMQPLVQPVYVDIAVGFIKEGGRGPALVALNFFQDSMKFTGNTGDAQKRSKERMADINQRHDLVQSLVNNVLPSILSGTPSDASGSSSGSSSGSASDSEAAETAQTWMLFLSFVLRRVDTRCDFAHGETLWNAAIGNDTTRPVFLKWLGQAVPVVPSVSTVATSVFTDKALVSIFRDLLLPLARGEGRGEEGAHPKNPLNNVFFQAFERFFLYSNEILGKLRSRQVCSQYKPYAYSPVQNTYTVQFTVNGSDLEGTDALWILLKSLDKEASIACVKFFTKITLNLGSR